MAEYRHNLGVGNALLNGTQNALNRKSNMEKMDSTNNEIGKWKTTSQKRIAKESINTRRDSQYIRLMVNASKPHRDTNAHPSTQLGL